MTLVLTFLLILGPQAQAPREPPLSGTAVVRGQVTDRETGVPIPRAAVTLRLLSGTQSNWLRRNLTDHEGRFEFRQLPAGSYELIATAGEYRATHADTMLGEMPSGGYRTLKLKDGEVRANLALALPRAFAVSGRVTDDFGDPLAGVDVRLTTVGRPGSVTHMRRTDDRGQFRLFGVPAGRYIVCANVHHRSSPRSRTRSGAERFVSTCHPSALDERDAQPVTVTAADVDGADIRLRRSRTFTISGVVLDSSGAVAESATVSFNRYERSGGSSGTTMSSSGRFEYSEVLPGEYGIEAYFASGPEGGTGTPRERGYVPVTIVDADAMDLVVRMRPPASVHGRIVFEDGRPQTAAPEPMTVECLRLPGGGRFGPPIRPASVDADLSFSVTGIFGPARLSVRGVPAGWVVKSIRYDGQDITDGPAEFATDPGKQIEIVLTSRVATLTGTVTDDGGKPATGAMVFLLPADPKLGSEELFRYRAYRTLDGGQFRTGGIRPGDYLVVAVNAEQTEALMRQRPKAERLAKYAEQISLTENDKLTITLRVVSLPDVR